MGNHSSDIIRFEDKREHKGNASEQYTVDGDQVYERLRQQKTPLALPTVVDPKDVYILELAVRSNRLEWQGYEALYERGAWRISLQTDSGLNPVKTVERLSQAWLYVNGWEGESDGI